MNKEIQEKRIEKELSILENSTLNIKVKKLTKEEYMINIRFKGSDLNSNLDGDIEFVLFFGHCFPYKSPKVFCKTQVYIFLSKFTFPNIADGRDLIEDILGQSWIPSFKIIEIISKIPDFVNYYVKHLQEGELHLVGNHYLGENYDLSFLETLPVFIRKVKEKYLINTKEREVNRILMVSDIYICLFEDEKWNKNSVQLIFWANLRSLVTLKKIAKENIVRFFFKQNHNKSLYELALNIKDADILISSIVNTTKSLGINYTINKHGPQKSGTLPKIEIDKVENILRELEPNVINFPENESIHKIMDLYQKVNSFLLEIVEYYSASNNEKYQNSLAKLHSFLNCPNVKRFLGEDKHNKASSTLRKHMKIDNNIDGFSVNSLMDDIFTISKFERNKKINENKEEISSKEVEKKINDG